MIRVHHAPKARSVRVLWVLEELGVPYEVVPVTFAPEALRAPAFLRVNPFARIPAIEDGEVAMFESGAIVEYVLERYGQGRLAPVPGTPARAPYLQWLHFGEATLLPPLSDVAQHSFLRPPAERLPAVAEDVRRRAAVTLDVLEQVLAGRTYICGDAFTAADIMVGYGVALTQLLGVLGAGHRAVGAYLERLQGRVAFQKAFA